MTFAIFKSRPKFIMVSVIPWLFMDVRPSGPVRQSSSSFKSRMVVIGNKLTVIVVAVVFFIAMFSV